MQNIISADSGLNKDMLLQVHTEQQYLFHGYLCMFDHSAYICVMCCVCIVHHDHVKQIF